jgi:hypothetical protein
MAVEALVARPIRDQQRAIVEHLHEARVVPFRRDVALAEGAGGADEHEGRVGDEGPAVGVQRRHLLEPRAVGRFAEQLAQLVQRGHDLVEAGVHGHRAISWCGRLSAV